MTQQLSPSKRDLITPYISVVIPTYRNAIGLPMLAERLTGVLRGLEKPWEVILVDDCSPDDTWGVIEQLSAQYSGIRGIQLARNLGQARATLCGINLAAGEIVATMDDDLQHAPELLPLLVSELDSDNGYDAVFAWFPDKKHSRLSNFGSRVIRYLNAQAFGLGSTKISSYRLMRKQVADFIRTNTSTIGTAGTLVLAATKHIKSVPVEHHDRAFGNSNYTFASQLRFALTNLFAVSLLPLRFISWLGIATAIASAIMVLTILVRYFTTGFGVPGWATLVILVTFFSGIILLSLGVIGEYLVRVLRELQYTRSFSVRKTSGF
jgi:polyisoprenyl-phosphate glycosyltransferase